MAVAASPAILLCLLILYLLSDWSGTGRAGEFGDGASAGQGPNLGGCGLQRVSEEERLLEGSVRSPRTAPSLSSHSLLFFARSAS